MFRGRALAEWWAHLVAHFEFTRINIESTIFRKQIEDLREARHSDTRDAGRRPCATATHLPPKITISRVKTNLHRPLFF